MFKWSCYEIYNIYLQYIKNICGKFISEFSCQRIKKISCNSFIKKDLKLRVKKICFQPLKQCLSGHVMQFIIFISNILKISVANLFHSFYVKESKKSVWTIQPVFKLLLLNVLTFIASQGHVQVPNECSFEILKSRMHNTLRLTNDQLVNEIYYWQPISEWNLLLCNWKMMIMFAQC